MGYPMTWQRLINRNSLGDGDYTTPPLAWHRMKSVILDGYQNDPVTLRSVLASYDGNVEHHNHRMAMFAGDLRRLEKDGRDERGICERIAHRTGFESDVVAAVLKEFFAL